MNLYHYTCSHGREALGEKGNLVPPRELISAAKVATYPKWQQILFDFIWLTDLDVPHREALGLTSLTISCDRTQHRYLMRDYRPMRWLTVRADFPKRLRNELENAPGALPAHWWIAYTPVPVELDHFFEAAG